METIQNLLVLLFALFAIVVMIGFLLSALIGIAVFVREMWKELFQ